MNDYQSGSGGKGIRVAAAAANIARGAAYGGAVSYTHLTLPTNREV